MKFSITFKEFVNEEDSYAIVATGKDSLSLDNRLTVDTINAALERVTKEPFITPYIGLGSIARVLAYAHIILPQHIILDNDAGEVVFDVTNFGAQLTDRNPNIDGNITDVAYYVYFEYMRDDNGKYIVFVQLVSSEELEELLHTDLDGDNEEGESPEHQALVKGDVNEEPINEISKQKLHHYIHKAQDDIEKRVVNIKKSDQKIRDVDSIGVEPRQDTIDNHKKAVMKLVKRSIYQEKAKRCYLKGGLNLPEETVNEISREKLNQYINKAGADAVGRAFRGGHALTQGDMKGLHNHMEKSKKRSAGIERAKLKAANKPKELGEEPLDEISKQKLGAYIKRASDDIMHHSHDKWFEDRHGKKPKASSWGPQDEVAELGPDGKAVQPVNEVLTKSDAAGKWIKDFVKSKNPKFKGKSPEKRKQQALAAYYSARGKVKKTSK